VAIQAVEKRSEIGMEREAMDEKPNEKGIHQWSRVDQVPEYLKKYVSSPSTITTPT
jgi:hypothetical protein